MVFPEGTGQDIQMIEMTHESVDVSSALPLLKNF
jgi:hypothetical protein